ncbi:MAG: branched-chain amino acid ABC transporter permease [Desulfobacterales bacterium]|nr:branched-chain amino acid ABC transporter permease [Desulfobacterales bacterium]
MNERFSEHPRRLLSFAPYIFGCVVLLIFPLFASSYVMSLMTQILIFAILASSLDLLMGYTGLPSFGHATFLGTAAYTTGLLVNYGIENPVLTAAGGILMSGLVAVPFGFLAVRTAGPYFLMITLALGQLLFAVAWNWRSVTGGDDGLPGISRPKLGIPWSLTDPTHFYFFVLLVFVICFFLMRRIVNSPFGHTLTGIHENEHRMRALGCNTFAYKYVCFILSGLFGGVAGVLYAYFNGFVSPLELSIGSSGEIMLMVILGGPGTLFGPALGAGVIVLMKHFVSIYTEYWMWIIGLAFILTILYLPRGIGGYLLQFWKKRVIGYGSPEG